MIGPILRREQFAGLNVYLKHENKFSVSVEEEQMNKANEAPFECTCI